MTALLIAHAISAALSSAALAGATETAKKAVGDAYDGLKSLLKRKLGSDSDASQAVEKLEAKPDSDGRKQTLAEELESAKVASDPEIISAAQVLLKLIESLPQGQKFIQTATGTGIAQAAGGSSATVTMYSPPSAAAVKGSGDFKTLPDD